MNTSSSFFYYCFNSNKRRESLELCCLELCGSKDALEHAGLHHAMHTGSPDFNGFNATVGAISRQVFYILGSNLNWTSKLNLSLLIS